MFWRRFYGIQKIITCSIRAAVPYRAGYKIPQEMYQRGDRGAAEKEIVRLIEGHEGHVISIEAVEDHVHILAELSPRYAVSNEIATIKTVTARLLRRDYEDYLKQFLCGDSFWSRSYFVATSGGVTLDVLKEYVETQNRKPGRPYGTKKKK